MLPDVVVQKLDALPAQPGCYLFRDREGVVVYVGKAKSLRSRVRSYFQDGSSDERYFIPVLRAILGDVETVVVSSEKEAAILENALIKEHQPRFNVKLRDDKEFLSLKLDPSAKWPRLEVVRRPAQDGARYFGPYPSATSARRTLHLVNKHFQLRTCTDTEMAARKRPCLQYQIKRCPAPCVLEVDRASYDTQVRAVGLFLEGRHDELSRELEARMREASQEMRFEQAAVYRDQIRAVSAVQEGQRLVGDKDVDQDVLGMYREGDIAELAMVFVRGGRVSDTAFFSLKRVELPDDELVAGFLRQHYDEGAAYGTLPDEILLPVMPEGVDGVAEWLGERRGKKVAILTPQRGKKQHLLALANENAAHAFREKRRATEDVTARLADVQRRLRLPTLPRRIECVDISHLGGKDTVGAVVAMKDGQPDKSRYRVFHVRGAAAGDDYGAMSEVLSRRFRRGNDDDQAKWDLPDLLVVDGGRGQLNVALAAARDLGLHELPIVGLAKERENLAGETQVDRVYLPGQKNGINLGARSASLFFLARARDEAHRFSNRARERLGKARRMKSELDDLAGVGPKTKAALQTAFGSLDAILAASDEALLAVPGVGAKVVKALRASRAPANPVGEPTPGANDVAEGAAETPEISELFPRARPVLVKGLPPGHPLVPVWLERPLTPRFPNQYGCRAIPPRSATK
jgi:excinuclease ABC subunit C